MNGSNLWLEILKKISSLVVMLRFPNVPPAYNYFYRDTYVCKLNQLRYFFQDYIFKHPYKTISFRGEFGAEMQFALPHAYWHHKNGTLKQTNSFPGTKEFYFFSPDHNESFEERTNEGNYNFEVPRIIYSQDYDMGKWLAVPLKKQYANKIYVYDKPILIVANRYNSEWGQAPISYFSIEMLDFIFTSLKEKYTIIYNRPQAKHITEDNSAIYDLNEFGWMQQNHPEVLLLSDLYEKNVMNARNFNHLQLSVYANSDRFISVHGGTSVLASYFGGKNIIFSKPVPGAGEHHFNCYNKLYPQLSGAEIFNAKREEDLKNYIRDLF